MGHLGACMTLLHGPTMTAKQFAESAAPGMWLHVAGDLHDQAVAIENGIGRALISHRIADRDWTTKDASTRSMFLLCGFAMENALKAFLVYENPHWVSNGRLAKQLKSHELTKLRERSKLAPNRKRLAWILTAFEEGIESWARYPCTLKMEETTPERFLSDAMWEGYCKIMAEYGEKLTKLIARKPWKGPHGVEGYWSFEGNYLGATVSVGPPKRKTK